MKHRTKSESIGLVSPNRIMHIDYSVFKKTAEEKAKLANLKKKASKTLSKGFKMCFSIILICTLLVSCSSSFDRKQVYYDNGEVMWVKNDIGLSVESGDTVITEHYVSMDSAYGLYSKDAVWGYYTGTVPKDIISSGSRYHSRTWYRRAIVIK